MYSTVYTDEMFIDRHLNLWFSCVSQTPQKIKAPQIVIIHGNSERTDVHLYS